MATQPLTLVTPEEYLELDRKSDLRNEYIDGEVVPIIGTTRSHGRILLNTAFALGRRLRGGPCEVIVGGPRLALDDRRLYVYPDLMVACGRLEYQDEKEDTLTNPKLIIEVLSPSTRDYDLGGKRLKYQNVPSIEELLFIEQEQISIEHHRRLSNGDWGHKVVGQNALLKLDSIGIELPVVEFYNAA